MALRQLKKQVIGLLRSDDTDAALPTIAALPPRQVVNPLFGALYHGDPRVRWHAVTAMGMVVARLADNDLESARVVMRRLMWSLNNESGGMGWGSPEAMGEIMACHARLAHEYAAILISYLNPEGNFLEHEGLQEGALWALGRLARAHRRLAVLAAPFLDPFLSSPHDRLRGLAVFAAGPVASRAMRPRVRRLCADEALITLYWDRRFMKRTIGELAAGALAGMDGERERAQPGAFTRNSGA